MFHGQPDFVEGRPGRRRRGVPPGQSVVTLPGDDPLCRAACRVIDALTAAGHRALLAGGCVRDLLLGETPKDYDVATSARPEQVEALFERTLAVGKSFGVIVVPSEAGPVEVATFRHDVEYADGRRPTAVVFCDAREDALRRDFTVNAMFYDTTADRVVDYVDGHRDLWDGILRAVGDPDRRFCEDYLRILRAVRFAARLGFTIEAETAEAIRRHAHRIRQISGERIRQELEAIFCDESSRAGAMRLADRLGLLEHLFPEVVAGKGVDQGEAVHPEGDVFVHTMLALEHVRGDDFVRALGALLHDIGKPPTREVDDSGVHFYGHQTVGAEMAAEVARRLRLSSDERKRLAYLVKGHMEFMNVPKMRPAKVKRFMSHPWIDDLLEVYRADCLASGGTERGYTYFHEMKRMLEKEGLKPDPLLTGHDLIELGLTPGPRFSELLSRLYDRQLEGDVTTRDEAIDLLKNDLLEETESDQEE